MPRTAKPIQFRETEQPSLFLPSELPELPALTVAAKEYVHTGKIVTKDHERAQAIAEKYLELGSLLGTARWFHVSPNTVKAVVDVLEGEGKLDEFRQRLSKKLGLVAELAADATIEALQNGKVQPNVLPIMQGVAIEKKALLDGEATSRVEAIQVKQVDVSDIAEYLRARGVAAPAIDVESTVLRTETTTTEGVP